MSATMIFNPDNTTELADLADFERTGPEERGRQFIVPHPNGRSLLSCTFTGVRTTHFAEPPLYFRPSDADINHAVDILGHLPRIANMEACPSSLPFRDLLVDNRKGATIHAAAVILPSGSRGILGTPADCELMGLFQTLAKANPLPLRALR